jgi:hypothetical protein
MQTEFVVQLKNEVLPELQGIKRPVILTIVTVGITQVLAIAGVLLYLQR